VVGQLGHLSDGEMAEARVAQLADVARAYAVGGELGELLDRELAEAGVAQLADVAGRNPVGGELGYLVDRQVGQPDSAQLAHVGAVDPVAGELDDLVNREVPDPGGPQLLEVRAADAVAGELDQLVSGEPRDQRLRRARGRSTPDDIRLLAGPLRRPRWPRADRVEQLRGLLDGDCARSHHLQHLRPLFLHRRSLSLAPVLQFSWR
jgi:hypothetical protein